MAFGGPALQVPTLAHLSSLILELTYVPLLMVDEYWIFVQWIGAKHNQKIKTTFTQITYQTGMEVGRQNPLLSKETLLALRNLCLPETHSYPALSPINCSIPACLLGGPRITQTPRSKSSQAPKHPFTSESCTSSHAGSVPSLKEVSANSM